MAGINFHNTIAQYNLIKCNLNIRYNSYKDYNSHKDNNKNKKL